MILEYLSFCIDGMAVMLMYNFISYKDTNGHCYTRMDKRGKKQVLTMFCWQRRIVKEESVILF